MIAGLPGTGIGGLFYCLTAVWMPVRSLFTKGPHRWDIVWRQLLLASLVIAVMWITGELVGRVIAVCTSLAHHHSDAIAQAVDTTTIAKGNYGILTLPFLVFTLAAIFLLRLIIHGSRLCLRARCRAPRFEREEV